MDESKEAIEEKISHAMHERLADFKDQADSLTLEGVRRVLEKHLGMKPFALDGHKKFVKQWMEKYFYDSAELDIVTSSEPKPGGAVVPEKVEKQRKTERPRHTDSEVPNKKVEDLSFEGKETVRKDSQTTQVDQITEKEIEKAIKKRVAYFRENSESITMSGVRRLLEEDLKLAKNSLDEYKVFIKKQLDESLSAEVEEPVNGAKTSKTNKSTPAKVNKRKAEEDVSESSEDLSGSETGSGSEEEERKAPRKKASREAKIKPSKKQKISAKDKPSDSGRKKSIAESKKKGSNDTDNEANASDGNHSSSSVEESSKKTRDKAVPVYGKKVEHLKSLIKSCGMSVPPSVYKRAKDAPESNREAFLIKEFEGILEREGLSINPSEKEIKAVKKRKERAKDLEGIDMSNIVSSSRRRTPSCFIPPKPQVPIESDEEEENEEGDEEDDSDDENSDSGVSSEGAEESEEGADESD